MIKHNTYFEERVQSLRFPASENELSVGVISPGTYSFSTASAERVKILSGSVEFSPDGGPSRAVQEGESYEVGPGSSFVVACSEYVAYICSFLK
jgi:purine/pyrimidine-nucleoside phosphorylase